MQEGKTIGQLMEEMRQKAGAQNYHGHDYMDLQRFILDISFVLHAEMQNSSLFPHLYYN